MILGLIGDPDHTVSKPRASGDDPECDERDRVGEV